MIPNEPQFIISTLNTGLLFPLGPIWVEKYNTYVWTLEVNKDSFLKYSIRLRYKVEYCVTVIIMSGPRPHSTVDNKQDGRQ